MDDYIFRLAQNDDFYQIRSIWENAVNQKFPSDNIRRECMEAFVDLFENRLDFYNYWVAVDSETQLVVAWLSFNPIFTTPFKKNKVAELSVYVEFQYRMKGIASNLIRHGLTAIQDSQILAVFSSMDSDNFAIIQLVAKLGFKLIGEVPAIQAFPFESRKILSVYSIHD